MTSITIEETKLKGVFLLTPNSFEDQRGVFSRLFCAQEMREIMGDRRIVNMNQSTNVHAGTVRGLHYQEPPYGEMKQVRCTKGRIFDVAVDIRKGSPTFLQWVGFELTEENKQTLVIPEGFAHGFQALTQGATVSYLVTAFFNKDADRGLHPEDPRLAIQWPLKPEHMSAKDSGKPFIDESFEGVIL